MINEIKAFGRYITVKAIPSDKEYKTGLVSSHTQANLIVRAEVLSVGQHEEFYEEFDNNKIIEPGDIVFVHEFPKDNQVDAKTGEEVMFIRLDTIYGFIKKKTTKK